MVSSASQSLRNLLPEHSFQCKFESAVIPILQEHKGEKKKTKNKQNTSGA